MDELERAAEYEQKHREAAMSQRKPVPVHNGYCLNCGEKSIGVYCNQECREDAERFERARERNGL